MFRHGHATAVAIAGHCDSLQELVLTGCKSLKSKDFHMILCHTNQLRVLQAIISDKQAYMYNTDPHTDAVDLLNGLDWACQSLEVLSCKITVPRLDGHAGANETLFEKLALQTKLRALKLGRWYEKEYTFRSQKLNRYSLEMTLKSGLGKLSALENLEELNVSWLKHRVAVEEFKWMSANWPKLKRVDGVFSENEDQEPTNVAWMIEHHPSW
ncbi:hypothetical protein BG004_001304, partial [Podila humilis]